MAVFGLQNGVCGVQPDAKIVKTSFGFLRSIFDQNAVLKTSRTKKTCAEECSNGKKWVLKSQATMSPRYIWTTRKRMHKTDYSK